MKTNLIAFLFFCCSIPTIYSHASPMTSRLDGHKATAPGSAGQTSIRSVVAQGGELKMLLHVREAGTFQLNIYSMDGQIVVQQTLQEQAGEVEQDIAFGARGHGVYVVDLVGAGGQSTREVIW
jgi:hypothetical protein